MLFKITLVILIYNLYKPRDITIHFLFIQSVLHTLPTEPLTFLLRVNKTVIASINPESFNQRIIFIIIFKIVHSKKPLNLHSLYQHGGSTNLNSSLRKNFLSINNTGAHFKVCHFIYHNKQETQGMKNKRTQWMFICGKCLFKKYEVTK
jgi:hypothetical protein